jgi:hypothetical protein
MHHPCLDRSPTIPRETRKYRVAEDRAAQQLRNIVPVPRGGAG